MERLIWTNSHSFNPFIIYFCCLVPFNHNPICHLLTTELNKTTNYFILNYIFAFFYLELNIFELMLGTQNDPLKDAFDGQKHSHFLWVEALILCRCLFGISLADQISDQVQSLFATIWGRNIHVLLLTQTMKILQSLTKRHY